MIPAAATAQTPFGPVGGRTFLNVHRHADDLAQTSFLCGSTPVTFSLADSDLHAYIGALIECVAANARAELLDRLAAAREGVAS